MQDYRGTQIVWHSGAVFGFKTVVMLIPSRSVGFSIEMNSEDGEVARGLMYEMLDHYLGLPKADWPAKVGAYRQQMVAEGLKTLRKGSSTPARVGPSLPRARYAGIYTDPWYGDIAVAGGSNRLTIDFKSTPRMVGRLEHYQFDTFITRFDDKALEPAYVTFQLDAQGSVERVTMKPVSPIADFSWDYQDLSFTPAKISS